MDETLHRNVLQQNQEQPLQVPTVQTQQDFVQKTMEEQRRNQIVEGYNQSGLEWMNQWAQVPVGQLDIIKRETETLEEERQTMSRSERKKRGQLIEQRRKVHENMAGMMDIRRNELNLDGGNVTREFVKGEKQLLTEKLKEINLEYEVALEEAKRLNAAPERLLELKLNAQQKKAAAAGSFAKSMPLDSKERKEAMRVKEEQEFEAYKLKYQLKIMKIEDPVERAAEQKVYNRHRMFDKLASVFRKDVPLSHEDATYSGPEGQTLVNVGRAFLGSTKGMYTFEDRSAPITNEQGQVTGYKKYFFKEAKGCAGFDRPEGAVVSECASELQAILSPGQQVKAFCARDENGKVLGSFQEVVELQQGGFDLFAWQKNPTEDLPPNILGGVLREHTLDWLMCNYDTKGENFMQRSDGEMIALDKETSFMKLKKDGAKHMNTDFAPHSENTVYNVIFSRFAAGQGGDIDLQSVLPQIQRIEAMSDGEYMKTFEPWLTEKYGPNSLTAPNEEREKAEDLILRRKVKLREEYRAFFTDLIQKRARAKLEELPGSFRFSDEPEGEPVVANMRVNAYINRAAPPTFVERNKRAAQRFIAKGRYGVDEKQFIRDRTLLEIEYRERRELALAEVNEESSESAILGIKYRAAADSALAIAEYARSLEPGSKERKKAMEAKEKAELAADHARRLYKISQIGNETEREREMKTFKRHEKYDMLKKVFRKENPVAREDSEVVIGNHRLVNVGRAMFGGTKPMYIFEDRNAPVMDGDRIVGYRRFLYKEAVNCLGMTKTDGAVVTEGASNFQSDVCGQEHTINAFAHRVGDRVWGSFQEFIETDRTAINLFSWQANPQSQPLPEDLKPQILREHTLDWLLCNFDTKGENFLIHPSGNLFGFDKEASFSKLKDPDSGQMSETYKPHSNDTLYNVIFKEFAAGRLELNLQDVLPQIERVEQMSTEQYMAHFTHMLNDKYGAGESAKKTAAANAILARKTGLREEYRRFFTNLLQKRAAALGAPDQPPPFRFDGEDNQG
ncbi:MAG: hypothetical protein FWG31_04675 [Oscillospiraceae bacterium]|nr:hypothetical protein [Oscillospiraceae bacterium]